MNRMSGYNEIRQNPGHKVHQKTAIPALNTAKQPGIIRLITSFAKSLDIEWDAPACGIKEIQHYQIKYKEAVQNNWLTVSTSNNSNSFRVQDLKSSTEYKFKVRAIFDDADAEEGPFSEISANILTQRGLLEINPQIRTWHHINGQRTVYKLPFTESNEMKNINSKTRMLVHETNADAHTLGKTILFVGETGSGKTLMIDGMVNYILDVDWDDKERFTITDHVNEGNKKHDQTESQTEWITCYQIHNMQGSLVKYTLNVIDTPGFGDTRFTENDEAIVCRIRDLFRSPPPKGIKSLDAVCLVTQAPMARLTPQQRNTIHSIISIFGQDILKNIFVLITFADINEPPVKRALKAAEIPLERVFQFNNSSPFASIEKGNDATLAKLLWKMGKKNFENFFIELEKPEAISFQLSVEILPKMKPNATIQRLLPPIQKGLNMMKTIKKEELVVKRHQEDIKGFEYTVKTTFWEKENVPEGKYAINCLVCNINCYTSNSAHDQNYNTCTQCPNKCSSSDHYKESYIWKPYIQKFSRASEYLQRKYNSHRDTESEHCIDLKNVEEHFDQISKTVLSMLQCALNCVNEIRKSQTPLSHERYIELLIKGQKAESNCGWKQRIEMLEILKTQEQMTHSHGNRPRSDTEVDELLQKYEDYEKRGDLRSYMPMVFISEQRTRSTHC